MDNKEKARLTYNFIKYRKRRRELEANGYGIENADRVLKKNYHGKRRVGSNG